ncbi:MAG: flagellar hook protein FlgE [Pseudomonadota bacterium]
MAISSSLYTAASGLQSHGDGISIVGDNIANVSTIGFKASRAVFSDVLGGTGPNGTRMGSGVRLGGLITDLKQGTFLTTGGSLDLAISGSGFFVMRNNSAAHFYTRDGRFHLDNTGHLVNSNGLRVQGYPISPEGLAAVAPTDLLLGGAQNPPNPTSRLDVGVNLDSMATPPANPWPAPPFSDSVLLNDASNFASSITVYDSLGAHHRLDVYFRKTGANSWEWHTLAAASEVSAPAALPGAVLTEIGNGTLTFNPDGSLNSAVGSIDVTFGSANPQSITPSFGDPTAGGGTGFAGTTQFAGASDINAIDQDGFASGALSELSVDEDGVILGRFSNARERPIARLALATFQCEQALRRAGDALFVGSVESGQPLIVPANEGGRGMICAGNLEASNVDMGNELVTLIAYQRAFQANVRTITTADEMLTELAHLKR